MNYGNYKSLANVALGKEKATLVLKNANVVNVFTEEVMKQDIAIEDGMIIGLGQYEGVKEIDLTGKYVCPGFIDAHLHLESTLVPPTELIAFANGWGTTTFIVDPHEAVNVSGEEGLAYLMDQTEDVMANVFIMIPSCVPATAMEDNGCTFLADKMSKYVNHPRILGLGEVMDYTGVIEATSEMMKKLQLFSHKIIDGHAPFLSDKQLAAYALAKIKTDHECSEYEYAMKQRRNGMQILIREGSGARNVEAIVKGIVENNIDTTGFSFCTDDKHIDDIQREGHISYNIKKSIALGIKPVKAIKMATINTAQCYQLTEIGAVAPGYEADLVVLNNLEDVSIHSVFYKGVEINHNKNKQTKPCSESLMKTVHIGKFKPNMLDIPIVSEKMSVIQMTKGQITTIHLKEKLPQENGYFVAVENYNKALVIERHKGSGKFGIAPVKGFGLKNGAICTSVSHDSHNIIVIGDNDRDMIMALKELERVQGGYTIVREGEVLATLPLPIMGLISNEGFSHVGPILSKMIHYGHEMGVPIGMDPFITLSFIALPVIPEIRITTRGLYDVVEQKFCR